MAEFIAKALLLDSANQGASIGPAKTLEIPCGMYTWATCGEHRSFCRVCCDECCSTGAVQLSKCALKSLCAFLPATVTVSGAFDARSLPEASAVVFERPSVQCCSLQLLSVLIARSVVFPGAVLSVPHPSGPMYLRCKNIDCAEEVGRVSEKTILQWAIEAPRKFPDLLVPFDGVVARVEERIGFGSAAAKLCEHWKTVLQLHQHSFCSASSVKWNPGFSVLVGPSGCGKTRLLEELAALAGIPLLMLDFTSPEILSAGSGESERQLRKCFDRVSAAVLRRTGPVLFVVENLRSLFFASGAPSSPLNHRLMCLAVSGVKRLLKSLQVFLVVTAPSSLDLPPRCLKRMGRPHPVHIALPDRIHREKILLQLTRHCGIELDQIRAVAEATHSRLPCDLQAIVALACSFASADGLDAPLARHFEQAMVDCRPSGYGFYTLSSPVPVASEGERKDPFETFVGLDSVISLLRTAVVEPLFSSGGAARSLPQLRGVLLHGPSGCGKTALAAALSHACRGIAHTVSIRCPAVLSKVVGQSEKTLADVFSAAKANSPSILLLDEVDALAPVRGEDTTTHRTFDRLLSLLLTELDGCADCSGIVLVATTSSRGSIDPALLRPGRLDLHIRVPMPDSAARRRILSEKLALQPLSTDLQAALLDEATLERWGQQSDGWSAVELWRACEEAGIAALRESKGDFEDAVVTKDGLEAALVVVGSCRNSGEK